MYRTHIDTLFIFAEVSNKQLIFWESIWQAVKFLANKCQYQQQDFYPLIHYSLYICFSLFPPCSLVCVHCSLSGHLEVCVRCLACITVLGEEVGEMKGHFCFWLSERMTERQQAQLKMSLRINASCRCQSRSMDRFYMQCLCICSLITAVFQMSI